MAAGPTAEPAATRPAEPPPLAEGPPLARDAHDFARRLGLGDAFDALGADFVLGAMAPPREEPGAAAQTACPEGSTF